MPAAAPALRVAFDTTVLWGAFFGSGPNFRLLALAAQRTPVLDGFITPEALHQAPLSRSLGRYAGLVGRPLGELLHAITGRDRTALLRSDSLAFPATFETVDTADLSPTLQRRPRGPQTPGRRTARRRRGGGGRGPTRSRRGPRFCATTSPSPPRSG